MSSYSDEPYSDDRFRLKSRRPTSVTVIAVLHLVFGGFGLIGGLCGLIVVAIGSTTLIPQPPAPPPGANVPFPPDINVRLDRFLKQELPFHQTITLVQTALGLVLSSVLVVAGIGLLAMRPRARRLSLVYSAVSIAFQLASLFYAILFVMPAMSSFYEQLVREFPAAAPLLTFSRMGVWVGVVFAPLAIAYPIVVFVLLTRRKVVAAFEGRPTLPDLPDRDRADDWPEPPADAFTR
jgi:hypothetical protein